MDAKEKRKTHKKAVKLHEKAHKFVEKGKDDHALKLYQRTLDLANSIDALEVKAHALSSIAQLVARKRDFETAFSYMEQSIDILERLQSPDLDVVLEIYDDIKFMQTQDRFEYMLHDPVMQETLQQIVKRREV
jgi:hypothetical protein